MAPPRVHVLTTVAAMAVSVVVGGNNPTYAGEAGRRRAHNEAQPFVKNMML